MFRRVLFLLIVVLLSSCTGTKYLKENEVILQNQKIKGVRSAYAVDMEDLYQQKRNRRILGSLPLSPLIYIYEMGRQDYDTARYNAAIRRIEKKYTKKINKRKRNKAKQRLLAKKELKIDNQERNIEEGNYFMRLGEPVVVFDSSKADATIENFQAYLNSKGYFRNQVKYKVKPSGKNKVKVRYRVNSGRRYWIDSIEYDRRDPIIDSLITAKNNDLRGRQVYSERKLIEERDRIYELVTNQGYYNFSKQYIRFEVDTSTLGNYNILLREIIANPVDANHHQLFAIDSVIFTSSPSSASTKVYESVRFRGNTYQFSGETYKPNILDRRIYLYKDSLFRRNNTLRTQQELSRFDHFKFININYDTTGGQFIANIFTSPLKKYETSSEVGLSSLIGNQGVNLPGPFFNVNLKNRNPFHGLEILQASGNLSVEGIGAIADSVSKTDRNYTLFQYGAELSITFPQFIFPFNNSFNRKIVSYNPSSSIAVGYNYQNRINTYERRTVTASFSYLWQTPRGTSVQVTPISIGYIDSKNDPTFQRQLDTLRLQGNGSYPAAFRSSFLSSTSAQITFNPNQYGFSDAKKASLLQLFAESGGNLINVLGEGAFNQDLSLFRYVKFRADFRQIIRLNRKSSIAYRGVIGVANPYGGADASLPYEKYFYIGGSNSLRAWQARRLGPGGYGIRKAVDDPGPKEVAYDLEQGGDMVIEASFEYRRDLVGFVDWAYFIDAGNIWLLNSEGAVTQTAFKNNERVNGQDGKFRFSNFYREFAVGTGIGLRMDLSFIIFRIDASAQVFDPAQDQGSRYVFDDLYWKGLFRSNSSSNDRVQFFKNKTSLNIGIGFPF